MNTWARIVAIVALNLSASAAYAFPIAIQGTEGMEVFASTPDHILATYQGNSATFSNDLRLNNTFIFNNHTTPVGTTVDLGSFASGTKLTFELFVHNTGRSYFTGPASLNPDSHIHARVQNNWIPGATLVSFEDLYNGPFVYNDLSFSFTNTTTASPVPLPSAALLFAPGLLGLGAMANRKRL